MITFNDVSSMLSQSFQACLNWLVTLFDNSFLNAFLTFFIIFTVVRVLLMPLIGRTLSGGSSDSVHSSKSSDVEPYSEMNELRKKGRLR